MEKLTLILKSLEGIVSGVGQTVAAANAPRVQRDRTTSESFTALQDRQSKQELGAIALFILLGIMAVAIIFIMKKK